VSTALSKLFFDAFVSSSRNGNEVDGLIDTDKMSEALNPPLDYLYVMPHLLGFVVSLRLGIAPFYPSCRSKTPMVKVMQPRSSPLPY
jgi:hypothetical protein